MGHRYWARKGRFDFISRKRRAFLEKSIGCNVWVVTGTRNHRGNTLYALAAVYKPDQIRTCSARTLILGKNGHNFEPPVELNGMPWFHKLFREQNRFSFGFNRIKNRSVLDALHRLQAADPT
jgi:hypothetical protein